MKKTFKIFILLILIFLSVFNLSAKKSSSNIEILFLHGSNIYNRIFLFYFPISNTYNVFDNIEGDLFNLEILINKDDIRNEPLTPSYFETDLFFRIKDIPINKAGRMKLPITIRVNKKVFYKNAYFTIHKKENVMILNGELNNLFIKEITENKYFKHRFKWRYPIYFDIRLQFNYKTKK